MIDIILKEAERYDFPIIISDGEAVVRNGKANGTRYLSRVRPLARLSRKEAERLSLLSDDSFTAVSFGKSKMRQALVYRRFGHLFFMYLPMLENIESVPKGCFSLDISGKDLPEVLSSLSIKLFPNRSLTASSFARIASLSATLSFSEDTVKTELECDGTVDSDKAFYAFGKALEALDPEPFAELSEPCVTLSSTERGFSVVLYGEEIYLERAASFTAVAPYSFTREEYTAAFEFAVVISIYRSRK